MTRAEVTDLEKAIRVIVCDPAGELTDEELRAALVEHVLAQAQRPWCSAVAPWWHYEYFKRELRTVNLTPDDYEKAVGRLAEVLGI